MDVKILCQNIVNNPGDFSVEQLEKYFKEYHKSQNETSEKSFAEWIDIKGIRNGRHEWTYQGDNYTKRYSTQEMFDLWLDVTSISKAKEIEKDLLSQVKEFPLLRKLMSREEIKVANYLVKDGKMQKGKSDDKQKSIVYYAS